MLHPRELLLAGLISASLIRPSLAAGDDWSLCRIPSFLFVADDSLAVDETRIEASSVTGESGDTLHLIGDVSLQRRDQVIEADEVLIDQSSDRITASGNASYADANYRVESATIHVDNRNDRARFDQSSFEIQDRHARGEAGSIEKLDIFRSRYTDLYYTTCDPDDNAWHMRAAELEIDRASGRGEATHTTMYLKDVPILYLPYFQFPIDDRRMSGMLTPSIGYSSTDGGSLLLPVYWNIAPQTDMTITPAWYDRRGAQLNTENRYLFESHAGQVDLSYIDDREFDDRRWFRQWRHAARLPFDIDGNMVLAGTSDGDYFDDFDSVAPQYNDTRHLERHVRLRREAKLWQGELLWQDYQTLREDTETEDRPYNSLPRLSLDLTPGPWAGSLDTPASFEWADFERDDSVTGQRSHLVTSLRWDANDSWYFFRPDLQLAFTDYQLDNNSGDNSINRALPTLSVDNGLVFDRFIGAGGGLRQTLEPRLYFLYTPYEDQDEIPEFDTSERTRTYSNLFRNNRFNGADRIGDASQVTVGLASRLFDNGSGTELVNARIGQIYYFKDRRVSLDGERMDENRSDVIAEVDLRPTPRLTFSARLVYEPFDEELVDQDYSFGYRENGFAFNLGYYYTGSGRDEDELEQALVSLAYPLNERWELVGKVHHSLLFDEPVENLLGISYQSCCWGLKILAGQTGDDQDDFADTENSIYFEFTFKGLSRAGQDIDTRLYRAIPGYRPAF